MQWLLRFWKIWELFTDFGPIFAWILLENIEDFESADKIGVCKSGFICLFSGPIGISPRNSDDPALEAGMFLSDEPGYYEDGAFGIRIENIIQVVEKKLKVGL